MNDKELLEGAAKAAGITLKPMEVKNVTEQGDDRFIGYMAPPEQCPRGWFDPLNDDGDAFRLAVDLKITAILFVDHYDDVTGCPRSATRRAIVRAAAEIGKAK